MRFLRFAALVVLIDVTAATAAAPHAATTVPPHGFNVDLHDLAALRADPARAAAATAQAERLLNESIEPITAKTRVAPSGDKRDYISWAPYFWPNPATSDGFPYIRKDGERNPDSYVDSDRPRFERFAGESLELATAYTLSQDERFARAAVERFETFLLDPQTGMKPNLRYAQATPGAQDGRATGTIDLQRFPEVLDAAELLAGSSAWAPDVDCRFRAWCTAYLDWLTTSEFGRLLQTRENNIGTYFEMQRASIAAYLGREVEAREILTIARQRLIDGQIEADGAQPLELRRTLSFDYSVGNLKGLVYLARLGDVLGVDVWNYRSPQGGSLRAALDYVAAYRDPATTWPHEQIQPPRRERLDPLLRLAARAYDEPKYAELAERFGGTN